ncbi:hypothetical protein L6164_028785 [Bauhinia variegata]|uniref:Uncharacterized protein n=1 Tax=Bauhinia variegata TaxID=167791 RepID=A0ACB9L717_BAUVA|nr:hypothetical protein L6164_028785 [Bauhinia variegata]
MDTAVSFLLDNLPVYMEIANSKSNLPSEVENKINSLRNELHFMNAFLKDSQRKRKEHDLVREVVSRIIHVAHQAEDVIDTYIINMVRHYRDALSRLTVDPFDYQLELDDEDAETQTPGPFDEQLKLDDVDAEIQNIKTTINEIYGNKDKYGIGEDTEAASEEDPLLRQTVEVRKMR